jgi:hypothetical protein
MRPNPVRVEYPARGWSRADTAIARATSPGDRSGYTDLISVTVAVSQAAAL